MTAKAIELAKRLEGFGGTVAIVSAMREAAAELRRLAEVAAAVPEVIGVLDDAMSQWAGYYALENTDDIESGKCSEAAAYRRCLAVRDRMAELTEANQ